MLALVVATYTRMLVAKQSSDVKLNSEFERFNDLLALVPAPALRKELSQKLTSAHDLLLKGECPIEPFVFLGTSLQSYAEAWLFQGEKHLGAAYFPLCAWYTELAVRKLHIDRGITGEVVTMEVAQFVMNRVIEWTAPFTATLNCRANGITCRTRKCHLATTRCLKETLGVTSVQLRDTCRRVTADYIASLAQDPRDTDTSDALVAVSDELVQSTSEGFGLLEEALNAIVLDASINFWECSRGCGRGLWWPYASGVSRGQCRKVDSSIVELQVPTAAVLMTTTVTELMVSSAVLELPVEQIPQSSNTSGSEPSVKTLDASMSLSIPRRWRLWMLCFRLLSAWILLPNLQPRYERNLVLMTSMIQKLAPRPINQHHLQRPLLLSNGLPASKVLQFRVLMILALLTTHHQPLLPRSRKTVHKLWKQWKQEAPDWALLAHRRTLMLPVQRPMPRIAKPQMKSSRVQSVHG